MDPAPPGDVTSSGRLRFLCLTEGSLRRGRRQKAGNPVNLLRRSPGGKRKPEFCALLTIAQRTSYSRFALQVVKEGLASFANAFPQFPRGAAFCEELLGDLHRRQDGHRLRVDGAAVLLRLTN